IVGTDVVHNVCTTMDVAFIWEMHFSINFNVQLETLCTTSVHSSIHRSSIYERILLFLQWRRCTQRLYYNGCRIHLGIAFFQLFAMWKVETLCTTSVLQWM